MRRGCRRSTRQSPNYRAIASTRTRLGLEVRIAAAFEQQLVICPRRPALEAGSAKARHHRQVLDLLLFEGL
jgi:hypothetical protein